jgi:glycosyltransferase involved in cell wall biosynthesis
VPEAPLAEGRRLKPAAAPRRVAFYLANLNGGGVQKVTLALARCMAERGFAVELLTCDATGPLREEIPAAVELVALDAGHPLLARLQPFVAEPSAAAALLRPVLLPRRGSPTLPYLASLARRLKRAPPDALVSATPYLNLEAIWARSLARVRIRLLVTDHVAPSQKLTDSSRWRQRYLPQLIRRSYPAADAIGAVCDALADDVARATGLPRRRIVTLYNPVVSPEIAEKAREPLEHPWFAAGAPPVLLGAGRLGEQKDFATLVRAFARVRGRRAARLLILGAAKDAAKTAERQAELRELAQQLGVAADVELPGFAANPFAYMARAAVFVLSSRFEGLGNVLIEAMACGCPVVSTDCPVGPAEILENGRFGPLAPVGGDAALADAIVRTLDAPPDAGVLRVRAAEFSVERAVDRYLDLLFPTPPRPALAARPAGPSSART